MNNSVCFILGSVLICSGTVAIAKVTNIETTNYTDIENIISAKEKLYPPENILLVFDIDNTLLTSGTRLGGDIWYQWQTDKLALKPDEKEKVSCLYDNAITLLYELSPMELTEANLPPLITAWQQKHIAFALTSRSPDTRSATLRELKRNGIDFSASALSTNDKGGVPLEQGKLKRSWLYSNGVFFSSGQNKGVILDFLLKKTRKKFDAIVFIDDGKANIDAVTKMFDSPEYSGIDTNVIHYTRVESALNRQQGTVLTPAEAQKMDQDWKMLSSTLESIFPDREKLCPVN